MSPSPQNRNQTMSIETFEPKRSLRYHLDGFAWFLESCPGVPRELSGDLFYKTLEKGVENLYHTPGRLLGSGTVVTVESGHIFDTDENGETVSNELFEMRVYFRKFTATLERGSDVNAFVFASIHEGIIPPGRKRLVASSTLLKKPQINSFEYAAQFTRTFYSLRDTVNLHLRVLQYIRTWGIRYKIDAVLEEIEGKDVDWLVYKPGATGYKRAKISWEGLVNP